LRLIVDLCVYGGDDSEAKHFLNAVEADSIKREILEARGPAWLRWATASPPQRFKFIARLMREPARRPPFLATLAPAARWAGHHHLYAMPRLAKFEPELDT
jgi:hypothetical protein